MVGRLLLEERDMATEREKKSELKMDGGREGGAGVVLPALRVVVCWWLCYIFLT